MPEARSGDASQGADAVAGALAAVAPDGSPNPWLPVRTGTVTDAFGITIRVAGLPLCVGDLCAIRRGHLPELMSEVVGVTTRGSVLMPFGDLGGVQAGAVVEHRGRSHSVMVGLGLLGRVLDGFGRPIDGKGVLAQGQEVHLHRPPPQPLRRQPIRSSVGTGVRIIDALATVGRGQRMGVFAPAGVGKTTLLGMLARHADFDVTVVALIGERGRELREFIDDVLDAKGRAKAVLVVSTSDASAMERAKAAHVATAVAEYFRDVHRRNVLLIMDSVTRYARALREIGLAGGEPPARRGYPPSVFAELPKLLERAGNGEHGSITAFYTVLMEDEETADPIAEEVRSILDGHLVLSRRLAAAGQYPAIDPLHSLSRLMTSLVPAAQNRAAEAVRSMMAKYAEVELLLQVGEYKAGSDPLADRAIACRDKLQAFLRQPVDKAVGMADSVKALQDLAAK